jgi:hypothetical protein
MGVRARGDHPTTQLPEPGDDGGGGIRLARGLAKTARVDLQAGARVDERAQDRLVELGSGGVVGRAQARRRVTLHEVDVPQDVEQPAASGRLDLAEVRLDGLGERPAFEPGGH